MTIHTTAPAEPTYVRITNSGKPQGGAEGLIGKVGIVTATGETPTVGQQNIKLIFIDVPGIATGLVFNEENIEYITKKEYFIGALSG